MTLRLFVLVGIATLCGCGGSSWTSWPQAGGPRGTLRGEPWTILCCESYADARRPMVNQLADGLRRTRGFDHNLVRVEHLDDVSKLYYGRYGRRPNPETGMLDIPPKMTEDLRRLRELALGMPGGAYPFLLAMPVPAETGPSGPPEWDLRNANADYSLLIAVFTGVQDRRKVALEYVRRLRAEGDEAYYYHDATRSHVCVGSFDRRHVRQKPNGVMHVLDPDYERYKRKYPYYTLDGEYVLQIKRDADHRIVDKVRARSRLVETPR